MKLLKTPKPQTFSTVYGKLTHVHSFVTIVRFLYLPHPKSVQLMKFSYENARSQFQWVFCVCYRFVNPVW